MSLTVRMGIMYGILTAIGIAIYSTLEFAVGLHGKYLSIGQYVGYLRYVVLFIGLFLGIQKVRDAVPGGEITFLQGLWAGIIISVVAGLIVTCFERFYLEFINPGFFDTWIQFTVDEMKKKGASVAAMNEAFQQAQVWRSPWIQWSIYIIETSVIGFVFSLILVPLLRKKKHK